MSDQAPIRPEDLPALGTGKGKSDSQLRLVTAEGSVVFPEGAEPADDSPTIITKKKPNEAIQAAALSLTGSLRGRKLAHFELLEPIGVGGMAAVLRARDTQLDRFVALKILPPDMAQDEENVRRFHQEARAAARLDHENIARVYFCGEDQRLHFIAFEIVEGVNLRVLLEQRGRLPVAEAVRIILQIATGLEHAASRGVVHRDVKPSNIIISPNGRAKLVDMGLARSLEPHHDGALTQSGVTLGTFDYISPEQALEPREADSRSDLYSLGCTFYHVLTGQAPVPEGTAAKKLHHHQNMAPVDPRQLNPDIPDEVAAILARMMAKDPKDRYQRPVHLVQHLLQVAQKVGAADDVPEGVLFVDAPLPGDPRKRPLLLVSLGALFLGLLLALLSLAPSKGPLPPGKTAASHADKAPVVKDSGTNPVPKNTIHLAGYDKIPVRSDQELAQAMADNKGSNITVIVANSIDLPESGLVFQGDGKHEVTIAGDDPDEPKPIRFKYLAKADSADFVAGLTLDGGTVTFQNILFEIDAGQTPDRRTVASLAIKGRARVKFQNCTFVQTHVPQRKFIPELKRLVPVASIAVDNLGGDITDRPRIILDQCFFKGGQVAVGLNGPAEVWPTDCAFMPYGALFHVRGDNPDDGVSLRLKRCDALVIDGPAFRLDDTATCVLEVENSIFSRPDKAPSERGDEPDLIRQTLATKPLVKFVGKRNCYHNLNALWVRGVTLCTELDDFRTLVQDAGKGSDVGSSLLTNKTPIWVSAAPWKEDTLKEAFSLLPNVGEVRRADGKALGFEKCLNFTMVLPAFTVKDTRIAEYNLKTNEKVVDPEGTENPTAGVFKSLAGALVLAKPGDVVLIKHGKKSREVPVDPTTLKPDVDVTLKPFDSKSAPILRLDKSQDADPTFFFRMYDGNLVAEHLEFVIEPDQINSKTMTMVFLGGNAACSFKNCVITMRPSDSIKHARPVPLSAVTLADPEVAMKMAVQTTNASAKISFENCFLRGEGEVLTVRASRPFELEVNNSMLALAGSLLGVQAGAKELAADAEAKIRLNHVSAFLTEPLLAFHTGKSPKGFVPTVVDTAQNSLFVGLGDKPFVLIEANDFTDGSLRDYFVWKADHNAYCTIEKMLTIRSGEGEPFFSMNNPRWVEHHMEAAPRFFLAMPFNFTPSATRSLWSTGPDFFVPKAEQRDELAPFGATLYPESLPRLAPSKIVAPLE